LGEGATEGREPEEGRREPCGSSGARLNHSREEARAREERRIALRGLLHEKKRERAELETAEVRIPLVDAKVGNTFPPEPPSAEALAILAQDPGFSPLIGARGGASNSSHGALSSVLPGSLGGARAAVGVKTSPPASNSGQSSQAGLFHGGDFSSPSAQGPEGY